MSIIDDMLSEDTRIRAAKGLPARTVDATLQRTAQQLAEMLAAPGAPFSHGIGGGMGRRLSANGWDGNAAGENIAYGADTAWSAFSGWMASPGHKANILGPYELCGFGHAVSGNGTHYWAADYGSRGATGGNPAPRVPWWLRLLGGLWR